MKYVAFLKGINVGGKNVVKMNLLRDFFTTLGFTNIQTYIQSGNVIFNTEDNRTDIISKINESFPLHFDFCCDVIIRNYKEMQNIINSLPFTEEQISLATKINPEIEHLYVYLTETNLNIEGINLSLASYDGNDLYEIKNNEIYLLFNQGIRESKLVRLLSKMKIPFTARNFNTMKTILEIMKQ